MNWNCTLIAKPGIRPISQGIEFVGYRIWPDRVIVRKSTSLRIKRALRGLAVKYSKYEVTMQDVTSALRSYLGMLERCDSEALVKKILDNLVLTHEQKESEERYEQSGNYGIAEHAYREPEICHF